RTFFLSTPVFFCRRMKQKGSSQTRANKLGAGTIPFAPAVSQRMTRKPSGVHSFILAFPIKPVRFLRRIRRLTPTPPPRLPPPPPLPHPCPAPRSTSSNSTIAMAVGVVVNVVIGGNIVVDAAITIIVGIVVMGVGLQSLRSSLLLFHRHNFMVRHHEFTQVCSQPP